MGSLNVLLSRLGGDLREWHELDVPALVFAHRSDALTLALVLTGLSLATLLVRAMMPSRPGQRQLVLPALLDWNRKSSASIVRHLPLVFFLAGLPLFFVALADPHTAVAQRQMSFPGRRIALLIDASSSMMVPFPSSHLRKASANEAVFLTNTAAAAAFVQQRKNGKYHDLIGLVEFGDEAYVITPFTSDYDNLSLSISMIGDWSEYMQFPDGGTTIGRAIDRATGLFKAFDFLHAAGNVMVIFSDGEDTQVTTKGKSLQEVLAAAVATKIPVYLIRTSRGKHMGDMIPDAIWRPAVESTGGRFYAAATEDDVIQAIRDIDRRSAGRIEVTQYAVQQPRFRAFALWAVALWAIGALLKLTLPLFSTFP